MRSWVRVRAPVRVLDAGGWTDTWFAGGGTVCHLAVDGGAEVSLHRRGRSRRGAPGMVRLVLPDFDDEYRYDPGEPPGRHPLPEAALRRFAPRDCDVEVELSSAVPPGSSLGTSASVLVGLIAALHALEGDVPQPASLARAAHEIETVDLGLQSGVQDQVAAAYGGCNLVTIERYPQAQVRSIDVSPATWEALSRRTVTVYLGTAHASSAVHDTVIARLAGAEREMLLAPLRSAAVTAASALAEGDIDAFAAAMTANTEAQARLHPAIVSSLARAVIDVGAAAGAAGWKVNGAGGEGGTVTIVGPPDTARLIADLSALGDVSLLELRPVRHGARVVDQD